MRVYRTFAPTCHVARVYARAGAEPRSEAHPCLSLPPYQPSRARFIPSHPPIRLRNTSTYCTYPPHRDSINPGIGIPPTPASVLHQPRHRHPTYPHLPSTYPIFLSTIPIHPPIPISIVPSPSPSHSNRAWRLFLYPHHTPHTPFQPAHK